MSDVLAASGLGAVDTHRSLIVAMSVQRDQTPFLAKSMQSLLPQCDLLRVFLGEGVECEACLEHPLVATREARFWDERGDAGCFAWLDADDPPGFRVMARSGTIYPPDFCAALRETFERWGGRAIVGADGWILRQPFHSMMDARYVSSVTCDRLVHVLATDAILFYSGQVRMMPDQFLGAPEVALASYAQARTLPMVVARQRPNWLQRVAPPTMAANAMHRDAVWTVQPGLHRKIVVVLLADDEQRCMEAIAAWGDQTNGCAMALIIVAASAAGGGADSIAKCDVLHEIHVVPDLDRAFRLAAAIRPEMVMITSDTLRPVAPAWSAAAFELCSGSAAIFFVRRGRRDGHPRIGTARRSECVAFLCSGAVLNAWLDNTVPDVSATDLAQLWDYARPGGLDVELVTALERQLLLVGDSTLHVSSPGSAMLNTLPLRVDAVFERRLVINLDRRVDRWAATTMELRRARITAERWSAVDATETNIAADYARYHATAPVQSSAGLPDIRSSFEFFNEYPSQRARCAYLEQHGKKAIASAGAWAYLQTWRKILHRALQDGIGSILVMDDDVVFHRDAELLFAATMASIPQDWLVLQLGTLQHHWTSEWMAPCGPFLYRTNGAAVGSHAVGLRAQVFPSLLAHIERMEMPFDIGPLAAVMKSFRNRSFIIRPNIAIQRLDGVSDIQTSVFQDGSDRSAVAATYHWHLADYPGMDWVGDQKGKVV